MLKLSCRWRESGVLNWHHLYASSWKLKKSFLPEVVTHLSHNYPWWSEDVFLKTKAVGTQRQHFPCYLETFATSKNSHKRCKSNEGSSTQKKKIHFHWMVLSKTQCITRLMYCLVDQADQMVYLNDLAAGWMASWPGHNSTFRWG